MGFDLNVNDQNSIQSTAKTLASALYSTHVDAYANHGVKQGFFGVDYYNYTLMATASAWQSVLEYGFLTNDASYANLSNYGLLVSSVNFGNTQELSEELSNLDWTTWALAAISAAEFGLRTPGTGSWPDLAIQIFNQQLAYWDTSSCGGGLKWQENDDTGANAYKASSTQASFFALAAHLARYTGNVTFSNWAEKSYRWIQDVGIMTRDYHVYAGAEVTSNCTTINKAQWSADVGLFTEGAAIMYNITHGSDQWKTAVNGLANATMAFRNGSDALVEVECEHFQACQQLTPYKGIAIRSLARAAVAAPIIVSSSLTSLLQGSAAGAAKTCAGNGTDVTCGSWWAIPSHDGVKVKDGGLYTAFIALEAVQGLLWTNAKPLWNASTSTATTSGSGGAQSGGKTSAGSHARRIDLYSRLGSAAFPVWIAVYAVATMIM